MYFASTSSNRYIMVRIFLFSLCFVACKVEGQTVELLTEGTKTSLRGLSVIDKHTIWVSGSNGMVGRSFNGGATWKWITVPGFEKIEFRDIEAFDKTTAVIIGVGSPAYILRTHDAGETWQVVFKDTAAAMFLDAMEFWNEQSGIVIGDPIKGRFFIARTFDGGRTWQPLPFDKRPLADEGEACFASSGTNIRKLSKSEAVFVSGGTSSHLFIRDKKIAIPFMNLKESVGANSLAIKDKKTFMVAGGDFYVKDDSTNNCFISFDAGETWTTPSIPPRGYRSCIEYVRKKDWITCGLSGVDITNDNGQTWKTISTTGFHVVRKAKKGRIVFFAGGNGRIGKLKMH